MAHAVSASFSCFCFILLQFFKTVKTPPKLEKRLEFGDPYIVEKEMMAIPVMIESAETVFGKTGISIQLPGLCDPELAIMLPFLETLN